MAAHADLEWKRGEDIVVTFTPRVVTDITGWTINCLVKKNITDTAALLTIAATITTPAAGIYTVTFTAAQNTTTLRDGAYPYVTARVDGGSVAVLTEGRIVLKSTAYLA